ncbi:hypothetical protein GvMRE_Ic1g32 [endosymbiont GvMRE of Glomus versiforme]|nr:hypothetical protein GvMRE_Ic1g32 [endosymbiont GvMRE of Glomus versiforme]
MAAILAITVNFKINVIFKATMFCVAFYPSILRIIISKKQTKTNNELGNNSDYLYNIIKTNMKPKIVICHQKII